MEEPNVPETLSALHVPGLSLPAQDIEFFVADEAIIPTQNKPGMAFWRKRLFAGMPKIATSAIFFFHLPPDRTMELQGQIEI